MTDRQTVSTADYEQLKKENDAYKAYFADLRDKVDHLESAYSRFCKSAYLSIGHQALYFVSFVYTVVDLYKTYF